MSDNENRTGKQSRREFLATTGAVAGAAALGLRPESATAETPKRGGVLRFATRSDAAGLDPHRNIIYYVSQPLAATTHGLLDFNSKMEPVPGLATEWDVSKDIKQYTFRLRKGMEFHNGADVDAAAVKWNFERILDPKIGGTFHRSSLVNVESIDVLDSHTVRCNLKQPDGAFLSSVLWYPCNLIAPNSADNVDTNPIGCGPFKYKSWKRFDTTEMVRFENYHETGADGKPLPYLDGIVGLPKKEDRVRLTALRTGEADLIDNMSYADAEQFPTKYADEFNTWPVPQVGTSWVGFNLKNGPFSYENPNGHLLRQAAAHAFDREAIHQAIFYGLSEAANGFYSSASAWHMPDLKKGPEYDPDKAKFLLKKAKYAGEKIILVSRDAYPYMHQTGELTHAMWTEVGFNVTHEIHPNPVLRQKYRKGDYHADSSANSFRPDPDGWFFRSIHSDAPTNKLRFGYKNEKVDKLIIEARGTLDQKKRLEIYQEVEGHINTDLPLLYSHYVPLLEAASKNLMDYAPAFAGPFQYATGGIRTAWLKS
ncbi:MAG: ABC transporter substrate-binding protein [Pseudomonadota bacterium]